MLFNIDEKQLMLELKNKDERALKICMNKYYRYVVYIVENIIGSALPYEDKEAVVSNVFVALWNYSADLDTDNYSTFNPYKKTPYPETSENLPLPGNDTYIPHFRFFPHSRKRYDT